MRPTRFLPLLLKIFPLATVVLTLALRPLGAQEAAASAALTEGGVAFTLSPAAEGKADTSRFTVWAFSQANSSDPQVTDLCPDIVPRGWARWDRGGLKASDYSWDFLKACHDKGVTFVGGGTASVFFRDEVDTQAEFDSMVSLDAQGEPFKIQLGTGFAYRGSLASAAYRKFLMAFCELQIDGGVDGLFFDELNGAYAGPNFRGDGGFEDADVTNFGHYLCVRHPGLTADQWRTRFGVLPADHLDCALPGGAKGPGFDYRGYLKREGFDRNPLDPSNPLAADWGQGPMNRPDPDQASFIQDYPALVYWQEMVMALRQYARKKYGKEIYITANGIYPFVDFQCNGLYDWNHDGPSGSEVNYIPVKDGHLDGTVSFKEAFLGLKARSLKVARREVPVSVFLDWPGDFFQRYIKLPQAEREDYWRLYAAEAYATGLYFCFHLSTTTGEPTAQQQGMMPFFKTYTAFYRAHASLYHGAKDLPGEVDVPAGIMENLVALPDGHRVLHLVNHHYSQGFEAQKDLSISFPLEGKPKSVTAVTPDDPKDETLAFTFDQGRLQVKLPRLESYTALIVQ